MEDLIEKISLSIKDGTLDNLIRCTDPICRGATRIILSKLKEEEITEINNLVWGEFKGHSVAIVSTSEIPEEDVKLKLSSDDLEDYIVIDASFHRVSLNKNNNLFIGKLKDYAKIWKETATEYARDDLEILSVASQNWTTDNNWKSNNVFKGGKKLRKKKLRKKTIRKTLRKTLRKNKK